MLGTSAEENEQQVQALGTLHKEHPVWPSGFDPTNQIGSQRMWTK